MTACLHTQKAAILKHLQAGHSLTPKGAAKLCGCMRLGARIHDLKHEGHHIESRLVPVRGRHGRARVAEYTLIDPDNPNPTE